MVRISKIYRIVISALLSLLGFTAGTCMPTPAYGSPASEYGTPSATYKAKGVVVSESDDSPIKGIRTELKRSGTIDTAYTDSNGSFSLVGDGKKPRQKLSVELTDVDGEKNGSFAKMEIEADYTNETFTGSSGHWYSGEAEIDLGIIKMKPEEPKEPEEPENPE
jgi:putative lipoprotein (rSAM/lipoprotein system)